MGFRVVTTKAAVLVVVRGVTALFTIASTADRPPAIYVFIVCTIYVDWNGCLLSYGAYSHTTVIALYVVS